jgi:hypothetical protein
MSLNQTVSHQPGHFEQLGRYLEQPAVLRTVGQKIAIPLAGLGVAGITVKDVMTAKPEDKKKTALRDMLVLGATTAGTALAAKRFMPIQSLEACQEAAKLFTEELSVLMKQHPSLEKALANNPHAKAALAVNIDKPVGFSRKALQEIDRVVKAHLPGTAASKEKAISALFGEEDKPPVEELKEEIDKAYDFFATGGLSVLSGMGGGWLANKINKEKNARANENMVKEGVFQFVANIALCAVGAIGGLMVAATPKIHEFTKASLMGRITKVGLVSTGLSVGIFGGGYVANHLGKTVINPFFKWLENTDQSRSQKMAQMATYGSFLAAGSLLGAKGFTALPGIKQLVNANKVSQKLSKTALGTLGAVSGAHVPSLLSKAGVQPFSSWPKMIEPGQDKANRRIEPADVVLHIDDVPTAMALAGLEVVEPFIPLFFGFSGYRAGIGYRNNKDEASTSASSATKGVVQPALKTTMVRPVTPTKMVQEKLPEPITMAVTPENTDDNSALPTIYSPRLLPSV